MWRFGGGLGGLFCDLVVVRKVFIIFRCLIVSVILLVLCNLKWWLFLISFRLSWLVCLWVSWIWVVVFIVGVC